MRTHLDSDSILTATVGIASPVLGVITSFQEQIEWTLRVASLIVGLMVGAMSLIAMIKKMRETQELITPMHSMRFVFSWS